MQSNEKKFVSLSGVNEEFNMTAASLVPQPVSAFGDQSQTKPVFCNRPSKYTTGVILTL